MRAHKAIVKDRQISKEVADYKRAYWRKLAPKSKWQEAQRRAIGMGCQSRRANPSRTGGLWGLWHDPGDRAHPGSRPHHDWSKVDIATLREHLIDMDEVTMRAALSERALDNGVDNSVTGEGRTLDAIKRMLPPHVHELVAIAIGCNARTETLSNGIRLVVTSNDPKQVTKLNALGFMGIMVEGAHHQVHHLMMAKGEHIHLMRIGRCRLGCSKIT